LAKENPNLLNKKKKKKVGFKSVNRLCCQRKELWHVCTALSCFNLLFQFLLILFFGIQIEFSTASLRLSLLSGLAEEQTSTDGVTLYN
jgi:hypothetical protein